MASDSGAFVNGDSLTAPGGGYPVMGETPSDGLAFVDGSSLTACGGGYPDADANGPWADGNSGRYFGTSATSTFRATHTAREPGGAGFSGDFQPEVEQLDEQKKRLT